MDKQPQLSLINIKNLGDKNFFIPAYQRGYRWTSRQVTDLLEDILDFSKKLDRKSGSWYCLQPVVVTEIDNVFHVLDGQQRLTTIFLILNFINKKYNYEEDKQPIFSIKYETRPDSSSFLNDHLNLNNKEVDDQNIDYFFISTAFQAITVWFRENKSNINTNDFESSFLEFTKVIWYEVNNVDSIEIFTRLNMGKIPLTNAELVKALLLNSSNFKNNDEKTKDTVHLKQLEIASEWDRIEYALQNESLWYFLNNGKKNYATRIDLVLNLITNIDNESFDEYAIFRFFSNQFQENEDKVTQINQIWRQIKNTFQTLEEWYEDRSLYHKIGFLIATGTPLKDIFLEKKNLKKNEFILCLDKLIATRVFGKGNDIETLGYSSNNENIRNILLLHNIQTMLNNKEETNKFPFDRFKKEKWDVEHISAIQEEPPKTFDHQKNWLTQALKYLDNMPLSQEITGFISQDKKNDEEFNSLFERVVNHFSENDKYNDTNNISNLVFLDSHTNRSYKNAVYPVKRATIIERDKQGTFIPICTKNVFMKFYNREVTQMTFWGDTDRRSYIEDITAKLEIYQLC